GTDRVQHLVRHLASLEAGGTSDQAAARELAKLDPVEAAHVLKSLVNAAKASADSSRALTAISRAILFGSDQDLPYSQRGRIYDAAVEFSLTEVAALFVSAGGAESEAAEPADPTLANLSLGHKKQLARQADPDRIARLAVEGDARVVRELLLNPRMTEGTVVRLASRRPAKAETLLEIYRSPKWSVRPGVRKALSMNPFTPAEVTLKLLPHLLSGDLKQIANDRALHQSVRELAGKLLLRKKGGR
ncbi:MAG: hypothetical protein ACK4N5_21665, partial [Myxococcales bacterium]